MSTLPTVLELPAFPAPDPEPELELSRPLDDPLPLRLLRHEEAIDAEVATPQDVTRMLPPLVGLVVAGFAASGACSGLLWATFANGGALAGLTLASQWTVATTLGFFLAICAGLPGYWFHAVVLGVSPPAWRIAVELVRVQAIGTVVLAAVLPLWVAGCLAVWMVGGWLPEGLVLAGNALPLLCALPGMLGLSRSFSRMAVVRELAHPKAVGMFLTGWWGTAFLCTAPITIYRVLGLLGA